MIHLFINTTKYSHKYLVSIANLSINQSLNNSFSKIFTVCDSCRISRSITCIFDSTNPFDIVNFVHVCGVL